MRSTTGSATPKRAAISRQMRRSLACRRTRKPAGKAPRTMLGARCTKYQLEPAPLPRVSISLSSGNPWACANAMASATASMMPAHMIWLVALAAWPLPVGPKCAMVRPSACRIGRGAGRARSRPGGGAPGHDGERGVAAALDPAAHRTIEEFHAAGREEFGRLAGGLLAGEGAVER